jgi:hypothetical protein
VVAGVVVDGVVAGTHGAAPALGTAGIVGTLEVTTGLAPVAGAWLVVFGFTVSAAWAKVIEEGLSRAATKETIKNFLEISITILSISFLTKL